MNKQRVAAGALPGRRRRTRRPRPPRGSVRRGARCPPARARPPGRGTDGRPVGRPARPLSPPPARGPPRRPAPQDEPEGGEAGFVGPLEVVDHEDGRPAETSSAHAAARRATFVSAVPPDGSLAREQLGRQVGEDGVGHGATPAGSTSSTGPPGGPSAASASSSSRLLPTPGSPSTTRTAHSCGGRREAGQLDAPAEEGHGRGAAARRRRCGPVRPRRGSARTGPASGRRGRHRAPRAGPGGSARRRAAPRRGGPAEPGTPSAPGSRPPASGPRRARRRTARRPGSRRRGWRRRSAAPSSTSIRRRAKSRR